MMDFLAFLFAQIGKIFENFVRLDEYLKHQWILFLQYFTHAFTTILLSLVMINFKFVALLALLFAQIGKIFKNFVCLDEYVKDNTQSSINPLNYGHDQIKIGFFGHFCLLKLTKYWKILNLGMNISNTNEFFLAIHMHGLQSCN